MPAVGRAITDQWVGVMPSVAHTPGPWVFDDRDPDRSHDIARVREQGYVHGVAVRSVAELPNPFPLTQGMANARLIAAAPKMLRALELAWPVLDFSVREATDDYRRNIRVEARTAVAEAIAEAKGGARC
jgi:hypothetical protein